ncbi:unnamed protein product [Heterobilharzia americana]|nr:unnamed protein product [Heterobilharzia americana]
MKTYALDKSSYLSRIERHLQENEREVAQLKEEVNDIRSRSYDLLSDCPHDKTNAVKNLEEQIENLREELKYESMLRSRIEEELNVSLNEIRFYRTSTADEIAYQKESKMGLWYEEFTTNLLNDLRALINTYLSASSDEQTNVKEIIFQRKQSNEPLIGFGKLREIANDFKIEVAEICMRSENAIKSLAELEHKHSVLQKQYNGSHQLTEDALNKVAELISLSETLTKERDEAIECKENAESELQQLRLVIDKLVDESGQRTREEVDKVRLKANETIEKLLSELHHMEKERCQLAIQLECCKSNTFGDHVNGINNLDDSQLDSTRKRAIEAEKSCDELKIQLEAERSTKERLIASKQSEIELLNEKNKLLMESLEQAESQFKQNQDSFQRENKALLYADIKLNNLKRQLESVQKNAQHQIHLVKQSMKIQEAEYKFKIETLEKVNQLSDEKWRNLLDKQQKLSLQWRKEAEELANQLEEQANAFRREMEKYHRK